MAPASTDPFGTAALRRVVLDTWTASPDRFREDANAEADLVAGAYRDRVVVELAQNAADAAVRAGVPGRLLLRLDPSDGEHGTLLAANTGAPLDRAGVRALASLRASAKREEDPTAHDPARAVGRFGVGSSAVLTLTDEPSFVSTSAGVAFAASATRAALAATGSTALLAELDARGGQVPVMRLPHPADPAVLAPPEGYDTAVRLPLRDAAATEAARAALSAVDDVLLLALHALVEVVVELPGAPARTLRDVEDRWHVRRTSGAFHPGDLEGLPVEERRRAAAAGWSVAWALPRGGAGGPRPPGVLLAPTPTDDPLPWPAALVVSMPLEASRRAPATAGSTRTVLGAAAREYAALLEERAAAGEDALALVPSGLPAGPVDTALRQRLDALLPRTRILPAVEGDVRLRPVDAVVLDAAVSSVLGRDGEALAALAPLVAGLVRAPARQEQRALLRRLGTASTSIGEIVDAMPPAPAPGAWLAWARALGRAAVDPLVREQLATLPVPLAGGRGARGAAGLLLPPTDGVPAGALEVLAGHGLRVVDPAVAGDAAAAALLTRLGAVPATARTVLDAPAVAAAVLAGPDAEDGPDAHDGPGALAGAVLALAARAVEDGDLRPGDLPWAQELLLPAADGQLLPAAGLVLPGSDAAGWLDPEEVAVVAPGLVARWGAGALEAVGVARSLGVLRFADVDADDPPEALADLDGADDWLDAVAPDGGGLGEVLAVRDLDLVLAARLPDLLASAAREPDLRAALLTPVRVAGGGGTAVEAPSYAAWWLGRELGATGRADPAAGPGLAAVLGAPAEAVARAEAPVRAALGLVQGWDAVRPGGWQRALDRLADGTAAVATLGVPDVLALWRALVAAAPDLEPPSRVVAVGTDGAVVLADAADAVVVDAPRWRQVGALGPQVVVAPALAPALADVLDLDLSSERGDGARVRSAGTPRPVPGPLREGLPGCPQRWHEHTRLELALPEDGVASVAWWVEGGEVHATGPVGLAAALADACGAWPRRHALARVLAALAAEDAAAVAEAWADEALEGS